MLLEIPLKPLSAMLCIACRAMHRLHQVIDLAGRDAADPGLLDDGDQSLLGGLARFEKAREAAALTQLGHLQVQSAEPGVESAVAVAITPGRAPIGPFMSPRADQAIDIGLHDQLKDSLGDAAK